MSFRETRHFDINFRETRSISTTFSVPFSTRRPSLPSRPFIPSLSSPLGGLGRLSRGTKLRASLEKCPTTPHRFLFLLFPGLAASFIHAFFPLPPPPKGPTPSFLESMGPTSIPSSPFSSPFLLSLAVPSARKERQTPDRLYLFSTYRGKVEVEVDGERKKKKKEEREKKYPLDRAPCFYFLGKKERKKERKKGKNRVWKRTVRIRRIRKPSFFEINFEHRDGMGRDKYFSSRYGVDSFRLV